VALHIRVYIGHRIVESSGVLLICKLFSRAFRNGYLDLNMKKFMIIIDIYCLPAPTSYSVTLDYP